MQEAHQPVSAVTFDADACAHGETFARQRKNFIARRAGVAA